MKNALTTKPVIEYLPDRPVEEQEGPEFMEVVGSMLGMRYDHVIDKIREVNKFGWNPEIEEGFSAVDNVSEDLKMYSVELAKASNMTHLRQLEKDLRDNIARRDVYGNASIGMQIGAEFFDVINYVPLPFIKGGSLTYKAFKTGAATSGVVAAQESIRYPFDPLATKQEAAINVGSAFVFGAALQGLISIPVTRRARATREAEIEINNLRQSIDPTYKPTIVDEGFDKNQKLSDFDTVGDPSTATTDLNIADSIFTNSWLYKSVTTPMKRILQDKNIPDSVKLTTLEIANDSGILLAANKAGKSLRPSVHQNAKLLDGEMVQVYDDLVQIWGKSTGKGAIKPLDYLHKRSDFESWVERVDAKIIRGEKAADNFESEAMSALNKFYDDWEVRLRKEGMIGSNAFYKTDIKKRQNRIDFLEKKLKTAKTKDAKAAINRSIARQRQTMEMHQSILDEAGPEPKVNPRNESIFRPRYWDRDYIKKNRDKFETVLARWFKDNPSEIERMTKDGVETFALSTRTSDVNARVKNITDRIINNGDPLDFDQAFFGMGKSKHFKHRMIDIPNSEVLEFIHTNPIQVMRAYTTRTGSRYEFSKQFGGRSIDELLDDQELDLIDAGVKEKKRNAVLKDQRHLYERIAGSVIHRDPSSWDYKAAEVLRTAAQLGYLGSAGIATLTEPAKIIMEHGLGKTMRGLFGVMQNNQIKLGGKEARIAGEALEILFGSVHLRLVDDLGNNPLRSNIFDKSKNAFYLLNGLAPLTRIFKDFDAMMRSHTLIDYSVRLSEGKATKMEQEYLARYLIDVPIANRIAKQQGNWQKGDSGLYLANSDTWTDELAQNRFRNALGSGVANTILMGTPADKPIITDGIAYIPMHVARKFGMKEDPKYRGYARIESGLLGLPFQFYSYSLAAVNKTMGAFAHGQIKSQFIGTAAALGLGYMVLQVRTPDYVELSYQDQFARAFDYSGLAPLYSDLFYTSMATSLALGGPNITNGILAPKYPQEPNIADAVTAVAGAGPSVGLDYYRAFENLLTGNIGEGTKDLGRVLPFAQLFWLKGFTNNLTRAVDDNVGSIGIGRF